MRGLKVTETRKSSGGLAAELATFLRKRPHRQQPISASRSTDGADDIDDNGPMPTLMSVPHGRYVRSQEQFRVR